MTQDGDSGDGPFRFERAAVGLCLLTLFVGGGAGCDSAPTDATGKPSAVPATPGVVHLKPQAVAEARIEVHPVARGEFRTFRDFPGTVKPNKNKLAEITALVRGRVLDIYVDVGQEVTAGQLMARIYSSDLGAAQSAYLKAKARLHEAELVFSRVRDLLAEGAVSQAEVQRRQAELATAQAELRQGRDRLDHLGMNEDDVRRLEQKRSIRSHVPIHAPFAARVIARNLAKGEVVETNKELFVVADLSTVWVVANIPEKDIAFIRRYADSDKPVEIFLAAYPKEVFHGKITHIGEVLDAATRTMRLRIETPNPSGHLLPEMFATLRIYSDPEPHVLTIPLTAVQQDRGETIVFVQLGPEQYARRAVKIESERGEVVKVLEGLREHEQVVVNGAFVLKSELLKQREKAFE
jgi:cobalt-zinc-cadmium efflux system membrane fusion protein